MAPPVLSPHVPTLGSGQGAGGPGEPDRDPGESALPRRSGSLSRGGDAELHPPGEARQGQGEGQAHVGGGGAVVRWAEGTAGGAAEGRGCQAAAERAAETGAEAGPLTVACPSGDLHGRVRVRGAHPRAGLQHVRVPAVPHGARRPRGPAPAQRRETVVRVGERQGPAPQGLQDAPHAEVLPVPAPRAGPQGPRDGAAAPGRRWAPRPCAQATGQGPAAPAAAAEAALSRPGQRSGSASALRRRPSGRRGPASARVSRPS